DTQFNLRHVEPTAMFRGEMEFQLAPNAARLCRSKRFVERSGLMGVKLIEHEANHLRLRILLINEPFHLVRKVLHGPPVPHRHRGASRLATHRTQRDWPYHSAHAHSHTAPLALAALAAVGASRQSAARFSRQS